MNPRLIPIFNNPKKLNVGYLLNLQQGSEEWLDFRKDKITATSAYEILQGRSINEILTEKAHSENSFTGNYYTERGHLLEDEARQLYQDLNNLEVQQVGAVINTKYKLYACSPDGLVGQDGGIEIKCFQEDRQEEVFQNLDPAIIAQIQFNLFITERDWWDLVQYNPEVKNIQQAYHSQRFYPDKEMFAKFEQALQQTEDPAIQEMALEIINLESQLQKQSDEVKAQIAFYNQTKNQILDLKERLKQSTTGKIKKTITLGNDTLDLSIYDSARVSVKDPSSIPEQYITTTEVTNVFQGKDGKFYQKVPNTKLASNLYKTGKTLPEGFEIKTSRSISIKFNGETL